MLSRITKIFIGLILFALPIFEQAYASEMPLTLTRQEYSILQEVQNLLAKKDWQVFESTTRKILHKYAADVPKHRLISLLVNRYVAQAWLNRNKAELALKILQDTYAKEEAAKTKLPLKYTQPLRWQIMYIALNLKQLKYALNMLDKWFEFEENPSAPAWYLLASLRSEQEQWQIARQPIEQAIKLDDKNPSYYFLAVRIYYSLNLYSQAIAAQKKYMNLTQPLTAKNWNLLMQLQLADNRNLEAMHTLNIIWRNKFDADKRLLDYLVNSLLQYEQPLEAAKILRTWLEKNPNAKIKDWKTLVYCELEARRYQQAELTLGEILKKYPKLALTEKRTILQQKANINYRQGNWQQATQDFAELLNCTATPSAKQKIELMRVRAFIEQGDLVTPLTILDGLTNVEDETISRQANYWRQYINSLTIKN